MKNNIKTVVITGGFNGLGFSMSKTFRQKNFNVVISDSKKSNLDKLKKELLKIQGEGDIELIVTDISKEKDIISLIKKVKDKFGKIDYWINNAGINQEQKEVWELKEKDIVNIINSNMVGNIIATKEIVKVMLEQETGSIYTILGYDKKNKLIDSSLYNSINSGLNYFLTDLAKKLEQNKKDIIIGKIYPGVVNTNFLKKQKNNKLYDIYVEDTDKVAKYIVNRILNNTNNNVDISYLNGRKKINKKIKYKFSKRKGTK